MFTILERKPRNIDCERVIIDRGEGTHQRFVVATINDHSMKHGEWFWGHYFDTLSDAVKHFSGN